MPSSARNVSCGASTLAGQRRAACRRERQTALGVDDEARLVGGLQPEPQPPVLVVASGLDQPEAGPYRAGDGVALPLGQRSASAATAAGSAAKIRSLPVSAASQARVTGSPADRA